MAEEGGSNGFAVAFSLTIAAAFMLFLADSWVAWVMLAIATVLMFVSFWPRRNGRRR